MKFGQNYQQPDPERFLNKTPTSLVLSHSTYTCAYKPGCLMSHKWLYTPDCETSSKNEMKSCWTCRRLGQHPPNLQKIYPAQAKRVRRAPDRYSAEEAPPPPPLVHRSALEEQRRPGFQLHKSHPPSTHSGLSALSV